MAPGLWLRIESVVTEIAQPSRLGMDFHSNWFAGHLTYEIRADAGGSVLGQHETLQPHGPVLWLEKFIEPYLRRNSFAASRTCGSFSKTKRRPNQPARPVIDR